MSLGDNIKKARMEKGYSQAELADQIGVSQAAIYYWESGKRRPNTEIIKKIADKLDVSPTYLMGWEDEATNSPLYRALLKSQSFEDIQNNDLLKEFRKSELISDLDFEGIDIEMLKKFQLLNDFGKKKAIEQVELLTKIEEYRKKE